MSESIANSAVSFLVNEIYPCLQGEGLGLGRPSLLVRFQICNLRCTWCDTPYTHTYRSDPLEDASPGAAQRFSRLALSALVERIQQHSSLKHLILTGGEPTLQPLHRLRRALGVAYSAEVETNGTRIPHLQLPGFGKEDYGAFQWNVSPKASNAGETIVPEALSHWGELARNQLTVSFKFVIRAAQASADVAEVDSLVKEFGIPRERVLLMPEGTHVESQIGQTWLHDVCLAHGFRYTPRLHVILFGPQRGV